MGNVGILHFDVYDRLCDHIRRYVKERWAMSEPSEHINKLLSWLAMMKNEIAVMSEEGHFQQCGYKNVDTVEDDIEILAREVKRTELLQGH